jgi:hypothetical protein
MTILAGVVAVLALLTLAVAVREAMSVIRLSPKGQGLGNFMLLGWWKFKAIEAKSGPEARPHLAIYQRSVVVFVLLVIVGVVLGGFSARNTPAAATVAEQPQLTNDPRVIPAQFANLIPFPASRAAAMPQAARQES